jgi:hypothetical protein
VGGAEQLLGGNLWFAQRAQAAGAHVQLDVFPEMWHDFEMSSEGCGADHALGEGRSAYRLAAAFLKVRLLIPNIARHIKTGMAFLQGGGRRCSVVCEGEAECPSLAPVKFHYHYNSLPPAQLGPDGDCPQSYD